MASPTKPENSQVSTTNTSVRAQKSGHAPKPDNTTEPESASKTDGDVHGVAQLDRPAELGGQKGPEPTRYGDWEKNGRCTDF